MNTKRFIIGMTAILIVIYTFTLCYIYQIGKNDIDVTKINNMTKSIEKQFDKQQYSIPKTGVIDNMSYRIIFRNDENYNAEIFDAMRNRSIIADLTYAAEDNWPQTEIVGKVIVLLDDNEENIMKNHLIIVISVMLLAILIILYAIFGIIYVRILRPFTVMKHFAGKVAEGDLEFKLSMDKDNYFGAFTESFDLMREELMYYNYSNVYRY